MKTFGVSDKHTGPWLGESEKPDQALSKGRALFGDKSMLYVAVLDVLNPADGLPSVEILVGDARENLVERHGTGCDAVFDNREVMEALGVWWREIADHVFREIIEKIEKVDHMVATNIKVYSPGSNVKVGDFKDEQT